MQIYKKSIDIFICVICVIMLACGFFSLIFANQEMFSEKENRALQTTPEFNFLSIIDGTFFNELSLFTTDQFPARECFCRLSSMLDLALCRNESNGIIIASDNYLIARHDNESLTTLSNNLDSISDFFNSTDIPAFLLLAPRTIDVEKSKLPHLFYNNYGEEVYDILYQKIQENKILNPLEKLRALSNEGMYVYYRSDHHWTSFGAYQAYLSLDEALGISPLSLEYFDIVSVTKSFLGTSYSRSLLNGEHQDSIELFRYKSDKKLSVISPSQNEIKNSLYNFYALELKDKYQIFLGGNTDILQIQDTHAKKPRLLIVKDSFANSLVPFLSIHFDLDVVDLRYFKYSLSNYIKENEFNYILLVYGIETLTNEATCERISK